MRRRSLQDLISDTSDGLDRIHLNAGTYPIDQIGKDHDSYNPVTDPSPPPGLVFTRPVEFDGDPGAVLTFTANSLIDPSHPEMNQYFSTSLVIASSHVTLSNFKIRFSYPVIYLDNIKGAAVKSYRPNEDQIREPSKAWSNNHNGLVDIRLAHLDIRGPETVIRDPGDSRFSSRNGVLAQPLLILSGSGTIENSIWRGGNVSLEGGQWTVQNNTYAGTVPTRQRFADSGLNRSLGLVNKFIPTYADTVFNFESAHDLMLTRNHASVTRTDEGANSQEILGICYRFVIFRTYYSGAAYHNTVQFNTVDNGIGRREDNDLSTYSRGGMGTVAGQPSIDYHDSDNHPELFLNETYRYSYEGITLPIGADRHILAIPPSDITFYRFPVIAGDVVAILTGRNAGTWRRIAQVIDTGVFLMDDEMPSDARPYRVSISRGMIDLKYLDNVVDLRRTTSIAFDVLGNQFDPEVARNTILGDYTTVVNGTHNYQINVAIKIQDQYQDQPDDIDHFGSPFPHPIPNTKWSRDVIFGAKITDNQIQGSLGGIIIDYYDDGNSSIGRTYLTATVSRNHFFGYAVPPAASDLGTPDTTNVIAVGNAGAVLTKNATVDHLDHYFHYALLADPAAVSVPDSGIVVTPNTNPALGYAPLANSGVNSYRFADPVIIRLVLDGNWYEPSNGPTDRKKVQIASAVVNGVPTVYSQTANAYFELPTQGPSTLPPANPLFFDFGDVNQTVAPGYTGAYVSSQYSAAAKFGWINNPIGLAASPPNASPDPAGDSVHATEMTFRVDVPNGYYLVSPTFGDLAAAATINIDIFLQGGRVDQRGSGAKQTVTPTYLAVVTDGHLLLRLLQSNSSYGAAYLDALRIVPTPLPLAFKFGTNNAPPPPAGFASVSNFANFDAALGYGLTALNGFNATDSSAGYVYASSLTFKVAVPNGSYRVTPTLIGLGTDLVTVVTQEVTAALLPLGNAPATASYLATVVDGYLNLTLIAGPGHSVALSSLKVLPLSFDFGGREQVVVPGYAGASNFSEYDAKAGFGWATHSNDMTAATRGPGTNPMDDSILATDLTFQVDLSNGYYLVSPTLGDIGPAATSNIDIYLQGGRVNQRGSNAGQTVTPMYLAVVTDGRLLLRLHQSVMNSTSSAYLDAVKIVPTAPPLAFKFGPNDASPPPAGFASVSNFTNFDPLLGYGLGATSGGFNAAAGSPDFVYALELTFKVALPNGRYFLTPTLVGNGTVGVSVQGAMVGSIVVPNSPTTATYEAVVVDGYLNLKLTGTQNNLAAISALTITPRSFIGRLYAGQSFRSPNGLYQLKMQDDGNLVEYGPGNVVIFASRTDRNPNAHADLMPDGNFVVYSAATQVLWASNTGGNAANSTYLAIDDNGFLATRRSATAAVVWTGNSVLYPGRTLNPGERIFSPNAQYNLYMDPNGNLALFGPEGMIFSSQTGTANAHAALDTSGRLVIYSASNQPIWYSNPAVYPDNYSLGVEDGGFLSIRRDATSEVIWTGNSVLYQNRTLLSGQRIFSPNAQYNLYMQENGDLVAYGPGGVIFSTGTFNNSGATARVQDNGNLVVLSGTGQVLWTTNVNPANGLGTMLKLGNDGRLVLVLNGVETQVA